MDKAVEMPEGRLDTPRRVAGLYRRMKGRWRTQWRPHHLFLHGGGTSADGQAWRPASEAFGQWCAEHEGEAAVLGLSSRWLLVSVASVGATGDEREMPAPDASQVRAEALRQWSHYMDVDEATLEADWVLRQVIDRQVDMLCAAPRGLIEEIQAHASRHGVRLDKVGPWWADGLQRWLGSLAVSAASATPPACSIRVVEPGFVTCAEAGVHGGAARLSRLWSEVSLDVANVAHPGHIVRMPNPEPDASDKQAHLGHLWQHDAVAPVLQGAQAAWQVGA